MSFVTDVEDPPRFKITNSKHKFTSRVLSVINADFAERRKERADG